MHHLQSLPEKAVVVYSFEHVQPTLQATQINQDIYRCESVNIASCRSLRNHGNIYRDDALSNDFKGSLYAHYP